MRHNRHSCVPNLEFYMDRDELTMRREGQREPKRGGVETKDSWSYKM